MSKEDNVPKLELPHNLRDLLGDTLLGETDNNEMDLDRDDSIPGPPPSSPIANNLLSRKHAKRGGPSSPIAAALFRKKVREHQQRTPPPPSTAPPFVTPEKKDRASEWNGEFEDKTPSSPMASMMLSRKHKSKNNITSSRTRFSGGLTSQQHKVLDNFNQKGENPPSSPFASILMARKRPRKNNSSFTPEKEDSLDAVGRNSYLSDSVKSCNSPKDVALLVQKHGRNTKSHIDADSVPPSPPPPPPPSKEVSRTAVPIPFPSLT